MEKYITYVDFLYNADTTSIIIFINNNKCLRLTSLILANVIQFVFNSKLSLSMLENFIDYSRSYRREIKDNHFFQIPRKSIVN